MSITVSYSVTLLCLFCVWNNSANASERQMQKISVYVMVHVSGGRGLYGVSERGGGGV